ncbi:site-specific integrase [Streptomyces sp. NPDC051917]|uniref:site-specific integrase n=1 Tax=Streptomyces sp. NPDC051917 TaxID=3154754 RepID=UPI00344CEC59
MAVRQRITVGGEVTYVVLDRQWRIVEAAAEEYLEHLRQEQYSPHTVRSYAHGLALWWSLLEDRGLDWRSVGVEDLASRRRRRRRCR